VITSWYGYSPVGRLLASKESAIRRVWFAPQPGHTVSASTAAPRISRARMRAGTVPEGPANCAATTGCGRAWPLL
jgi:hypothetical protein